MHKTFCKLVAKKGNEHSEPCKMCTKTEKTEINDLLYRFQLELTEYTTIHEKTFFESSINMYLIYMCAYVCYVVF